MSDFADETLEERIVELEAIARIDGEVLDDIHAVREPRARTA